MKTLSLKDQGELLYSISSSNSPRLFIEPGETINVETEDAFSGQIRKEGDTRDFTKIPYSNPQTGPIYVKGAEAGDTLSVSIQDIRPTIGQGATRIVSFWYPAKYDTQALQKLLGAERAVPERPVICKISDGKVYFENYVMPYSPMIGTISTADPIESYLPWFPGPHGGNMDIPDIAVGSTVFLPVLTRGALLHLGDVHAIQGDGELSGTAVEMPAMTTLKIDLVKNHKISWPRLETSDGLYTISASETGRTFDEAVRLAFLELVLWLEKDYDMNRWLAFELLSLVAKVRIGNFWTVEVGIPKRYLGTASGSV